MNWSAKVSPEIAAKRAGGRRHYNTVRHMKQAQRRLAVSRLLFDRTLERPLGKLFPWGVQKQIAKELGVSEGTVSRDIKTMMRAYLYPGLPAAKEMILAVGDRRAIARAVEGILKQPDLTDRTFLFAAQIIVDMDNVNIMNERNFPPSIVRAMEASICRRAYRLFLATLSKIEKREWFRKELRRPYRARDFEIDDEE